MAAFSEHTVTYGNNKHIFYHAAGPTDGPLLIFIHGWPDIGKTWIHQLTAFSSLGFRVLAPDMPGYGQSTSTKVIGDYSLEAIVAGMLALLASTGRDDAVWIGHDWGAACVWSLAAQHPSKCRAVANLSVPYRVLELGLEELIRFANRDIYPEHKYPHAQWGYQAFYEQAFDVATAWFDRSAVDSLKLLFARRPHPKLGQLASTATTLKDGGWCGGPERAPTPSAAVKAFPGGAEYLVSPELLEEMTAALERTGFFGPNAYYANHERNRAYNTRPTVDPVLSMPVLFVEGKFDPICDTAVSRLAEPQRKLCKKLTEVSIDSGHWVQLEKPAETNAALARWLATEVEEYWPGFWKEGFVKNHL